MIINFLVLIYYNRRLLFVNERIIKCGSFFHFEFLLRHISDSERTNVKFDPTSKPETSMKIMHIHKIPPSNMLCLHLFLITVSFIMYFIFYLIWDYLYLHFYSVSRSVQNSFLSNLS